MVARLGDARAFTGDNSLAHRRPPASATGASSWQDGRRRTRGRQGMTKLPIIAFAKDWHEDPHLEPPRPARACEDPARAVAELDRDPHAEARRARATSARSGASSASSRRAPINVENDLWVVSPLVLPLPHSPVARAINRQILRATIRALRLRLGIDDVPAVDVPAERRRLRRHPRRVAARSTTASTSGRCSATSIASRRSRPSAQLLAARRRGVRRSTTALADAKRAAQPGDVRVAARRRPRAVRTRARPGDRGPGRPRGAAAPAASASTAPCTTGSTSS